MWSARADNVADLHIPVVNNNGKVVSRDAIASHDHEIVQFGIRNSNFAVNTVLPKSQRHRQGYGNE